jgi:hypothetical protein
MPYFAYANLLDIDRIRSVAPSARPMGVMTLPGYRLAFAFCQGRDMGGATLQEDPQAVLYGVNFAMSDADAEAMDKSALTHLGKWRRRQVTVYDADGVAHETSTYFIPDAAPGWFEPPFESYVLPMRKGMAAFGFPAAYQQRVEAVLTGTA